MFGKFMLWNVMGLMTIVCGLWAMSHFVSVILAGGVGKNGSTVAVSQQKLRKDN